MTSIGLPVKETKENRPDTDITRVLTDEVGLGEVAFGNGSEGHQKVSLEILAQGLEVYEPGSKLEKRLLRKVDLTLLPMLWLMCVLAYVDRNNIVRPNLGRHGSIHH